MADEGTQLELGLDRGRLVILNAFCWRQEDGSWTVRLIHRHEGELAVCPGRAEYHNLTTEETADVLCGTLSRSDSRFQLLGGDCHPIVQ